VNYRVPWTSTAQVTHVTAAQHMSWEPCRRMCMKLEDIGKHGTPGSRIRIFEGVADSTLVSMSNSFDEEDSTR
jgi:hypothetical protein